MQQSKPLSGAINITEQGNEPFGIIRYIKEFCDIMVADLPSPVEDVKEQIRQCNENPTRSDISKFNVGSRKFDYLDIGYIELCLNEIFGNNWNDFQIFPGFVSEQITEDKINIHVEIILVVKWANGAITPYIGRGTGLYLPKSPTANLSFAKSTARAEAVKNAARHLGPRFAMGLKSLVESGQIADMSHIEAYDLIMSAIGDKIIVTNGKPDQVITADILSNMSNKLFGADVDNLQGVAIANMARIIKDMPSVSEKISMIARLRAVGEDISMEENYSIVNNAIGRLEAKSMAGLP